MPTNNSSNAQNAQYNLIVGTGSAYSNIAPSATSGVPLVSQGATSNPAYGTAVVSGGGTGVTSNTAYSVLCGGTTSTNPIQSVASVGTSGQVLTSNGAGALPTFQTPAGGSVLVQSKQALYTTVTNLTTFIPWDNTIPQNTEGQEIITLTITPTSATNILVFNWSISYGLTANDIGNVVGALFQDTTANALFAITGNTVQNAINPGLQMASINLRYFMTAGTTSATTFKIRMGAEYGGCRLNGYYLNQSLFGGRMGGMFQIQELTP
jgi:hypothetical protein